MIVIEPYDEDREALRELFRLADDSEEQINGYINEGLIFVAREKGAIVGHLLLIKESDQTAELKSMAVLPTLQGKGLGQRLIEACIAQCKGDRVKCLTVSTAAAGVDQLRFYQRAGFRMLRIERDAFTAATGYPEEVWINGILLRDRVWLSIDL